MTASAPVAIVAGSGIDLESVLDSTEWQRPFSDFPAIPSATAPGHAGRFTLGRCRGRTVIVQAGRLHFYEGHSFEGVVSPVDVLCGLGVATVLFTNAAGGLEPTMAPGDLLSVDRLVTWPYGAWRERPKQLEPSFVLPGPPHRGAYMWVPGPNYETRAEINAMRALGAAAVGMSAAPEIARAHRLGMRTAVISCITNNCCSPQVLTHQHVLETASRASQALAQLIVHSLPLL